MLKFNQSRIWTKCPWKIEFSNAWFLAHHEPSGKHHIHLGQVKPVYVYFIIQSKSLWKTYKSSNCSKTSYKKINSIQPCSYWKTNIISNRTDISAIQTSNTEHTGKRHHCQSFPMSPLSLLSKNMPTFEIWGHFSARGNKVATPTCYIGHSIDFLDGLIIGLHKKKWAWAVIKKWFFFFLVCRGDFGASH